MAVFKATPYQIKEGESTSSNNSVFKATKYQINETENVMKSEDFEAKSGYVSTESTNWWKKLWSSYGLGYDDLTYEYINNQNGLRDEIKSKYTTYSRDNPFAESESDFEQKGYDFINEQEVSLYNYYYNTGGKDKAQEYLDSLEDTLVQRKAGKEYEALEGNTLKELFYGVVAGADQFRSGVENVGAFITGDEGQTSSTQYVSGKVRDDLADDGFKILGSSVGQIGYDLINTTTNMLPSVLVGAATGGVGGLATMGASVLGNSYSEMRKLGYDEWQSRGYAAAVTAAEVALQKVLGGISSLGGGNEGIFQTIASKVLPKVDNAIAKAAIQLGGNMLDEGLEEAIQEILDPIFKAMATGEDFEGIDLENVLYSGLIGALSAGTLEGMSTIQNTASNIKSDIRAKEIYGDSVQDLLVEAVDIGGEAANVADKYLAKYEKKGKLSGANLNAIVNANEQEMMRQDKAKMKSAVEAKLTEYGETGDVSAIADILVKRASGEPLTSKEVNTLNKSKAGHQVSGELNEQNLRSGALANDWAADIGTERINADVYNRDLYDLAKMATGSKDGAIKASVAKALDESGGAEEAQIEVSDNGKNMYYDAETDSYLDADIKGIVSTKGGVKVELENGKTVKASDLRFASREEGVVYEMLARMDVTPETANEIISTFKPTDANQASLYFDSIPLAYRMGLMNNAQGLKYINLPEAQKRIVYNRGRMDAITNAKERDSARATSPTKAKAEASKTEKNGIIYEDGFVYDEATANDLQKKGMAGAEAIAKMTNLEVHVFDSKDMSDANGYFKDGNKIYINLSAGMNAEGAMLYAMSHEIGHYIRKWNAQGFKDLADFLIAEYGKHGVDVTGLIERQKDKIRNRYSKNNWTLPSEAKLFDMAYEEMVADAMSDMLADPNAYKKLEKFKKKNFKAWKKLGEIIKQLLDKLKNALGIYRKNSPVAEEALHVRDFSIEAYNKLQDLYIKAFVEADANYESSKGGSKETKPDTATSDKQFSIREAFYDEFDAWDKKDTNKTFIVGTTSEALKSIGMKDQNIILRSGTVLQKISKHSEISLDTFKGIPELLEHPILVQFSDAIDQKTKKPKYESRITVLGELYADGKPVLVSLELLPTNQKKTVVLDFSVVVSAYAKDALQQYINENSILYIEPNKKRTNKWLSLNRLSLPLGEIQYGSVRSITYADGKVKVKNKKNLTPTEIALRKAGIVDEFGNYINKSDSNADETKHSDRDTIDSLMEERLTIQSKLHELRKTKKELESSEEYNSLVSKVSTSKGSEADAALKEYTEWISRTKYKEIVGEIKSLEERYADLNKKSREMYEQKAIADERKAIEESGLSESEYFRKQAVKEFGYTPFFYDAGYLLPNGKLLNFSGEKGKHFGSRGQDHRAIETIYANVSRSKAMLKFMSEGNIRVMSETPGLDISSVAEPTAEQYISIKRFVREYAKEGYIAVDITDENGNVIGTYSYENNINADRVVNDIKYYYENGTMRPQSSIANFLYSDRDSYAPTFYSHMGKVIDGIKDAKVGANGVVAYLKGKGVKDEEIKWSGIETFLEGKKSVTKAELQEFVAGSQLEIEEETRSDKEIPYDEYQLARISAYEREREGIAEELKSEWKRVFGNDIPIRNFGAGLESDVVTKIFEAERDIKKSTEVGKAVERAREELKKIFENDDFGYESSKKAYMAAVRDPETFMYENNLTDEEIETFERYLRAKADYNRAEGVPLADKRALKDIAAKADSISRMIGKVKNEHYAEAAKHMTKWRQYILDGGTNYRELVFKLPNATYTNASMMVHWGDEAEGVLAHARIQDMTTSNGKKMLFVEEIQSDWHNEGARKGYADNKEKSRIEGLKAKNDEAFFKLEDYSTEVTGSAGEWETIKKTTKGAKLLHEYREARAAYNNAMDEFETRLPDAPFRTTYHEYVLKRLLRMAAEEGYDSIGWTPADVQMSRWNPDRRTNAQMGIEDAKNPDAVAFEDGYRIEYDQDIPKFLRKYGKKWGANVGKTWIDAYTSSEEDFLVWSMDITDSMKESVLHEGQVLYSDRDTATFNGKPFWSGSVSLLDGVIEEVHSMDEAEAADYHHSMYFSSAQVEKMDNGDNAFFFVDNGTVHGEWRESIPKHIIDRIKEQIVTVPSDPVAREFSDADIKYSIREEAPPKNTKEGYKVFVVKNGKLYPPMVANPNAEDTPVGVWLNADVGTRAADSKTGRPQVKAGGKGTQGGSGSLAFRPGWHLGETPLATQFDRLNPETGVKELFPENFVWALCDIAADHDYQEEAMSYGYTKSGKFQHSLAGLPKLPVDGYYKYRTNPNPDTVPWLITGAMKVKKLLSDAEVNAILESQGLSPKKRVGGDKTLADLGLAEYEDKVYSDRDTDSVSNRTLLANALESVAQNDIEKTKLTQYKEKIALIESEQKKLSEIKAKIKELSFAKGARDTEAIKKLQFDANQIANRINTYDKQLLSLESTKALKGVLEREKANLRKRLEKQGKEALNAQKAKNAETVREIMNRNTESRKKAVESRNKTEMRRDIKKLLQRIRKVFKGGKERNVKESMKGTVATALALGDVLFSNEISNIDIVNLGVDSVTEKESKLLNEYRDILMKKESNLDKIGTLRATLDADNKEQVYSYISELEAQNRRYDRRISELNGLLSDVFVRERARLNRMPVTTLINELAAEYLKLKSAEEEYIKVAFESALYDRLVALSDDLDGVIARDMSLDQLKKVKKVFTMLEHTIQTANKEFRNGKWEDLQQRASAVMEEIEKLKNVKPQSSLALSKMKSYLWNELTPYYAFDKIGSETLMEYFWDLIKGQSVAARDFDEANDFASATREKYGYSKWKLDEMYDFKLMDGRTFSTTLKHLLSVYAYSKREQADLHMSIGGFFHNDKATFRKEKGILKMVRTDAVGYKVDDAVLAQIKAVLGNEKMSYVDEMLDYLTKMGEKGNEVTRVLWGIDIFTEKVYFPLKSKEDFLKKTNETATAVSLKNDGMTKEVTPGASNPIVLEAFDDVWADHVERMSTYHGLVIPIDNLNKVLHYGTWVGTDAMSVSTMLEGKFTSAVTDYLEQWINDLNGGTMVKGATNPFMSFFSKFKKTVVGASLSTVVQQPTAVLRAMAEIDAKYFVGKPNLTKLNEQWEEFKKYAPIAIIKEIGGFDAGGGKSASRWINSNTATGVDKVMNTVDDISMKGAEVADMVGWLTIWEAVKRETADTTDLAVDSQEFLDKCGERATEVIVKTQVYDSTLSRSGFMRSKNDGTKMLTSFMGEPTLSINMMYSAVINALRGGKEAKIKAAKTIGCVYVAIILAEALSSAIYALRDDDEDESYAEKYLQSFGGSVVSDIALAPVTSLPGVKDIISIFQGWDVERSDMTIFKDIKDAFDGLDSDSKSPYRKVEDFAGAIAAAFGLPLKNILRTGREVYNAGSHLLDDVSGGSAWDAFAEGITGKSSTDSKSLYKAILKGDASRYRSQYKTEAAYETAIRNALRDNDSRIKEAAQARYEGDIAKYTRIAKEIIREGNFSQDIVVGAINAEMNAIKRGETEEVATEEKDEVTSIYSGSDVNSAFDNGDYALGQQIISELIETKVANGMIENNAKSSIRSSMTSYWKPLYKEAYRSGDTNEMARIRQILYSSGLYGSANEVVKTTQSWLKD